MQMNRSDNKLNLQPRSTPSSAKQKTGSQKPDIIILYGAGRGVKNLHLSCVIPIPMSNDHAAAPEISQVSPSYRHQVRATQLQTTWKDAHCMRATADMPRA